ncbi:MAG: DUF4157 domain-containing protein [Cyanobacteria bacterium]|nr:DUF4157 domain-containing protein [Cyanobacteriota bacterium]
MPEEEELQMKPLDGLQRESMPEEEELQMKPLDGLQRESMPEEEELQMKPVPVVGATGGEVSTDLEGEINRARGGGQQLAPQLQAQMGQAMGADFSGVRVHADTQADQLNRSVGARAFTTGQDVFFRQGQYQPGSRGGQELIAHELTHVVQQSGGVMAQRTPQDSKFISAPSLITQAPLDTIQCWIDYSTDYAEELADNGNIAIFDDRIQHVLERHGPEGSASGPTFHRFYTSKASVIKGYIKTALAKGTVYKAPGEAFDFEFTFSEDIGEDTTGEKVQRIRVVVVQTGRVGDRGKVQTAYPIS